METRIARQGEPRRVCASCRMPGLPAFAAALIAALLVLCLPAGAEEGWIHSSESIEMDFLIASSFGVRPLRENFQVSYIIANLSFFPRDGFQQEVLKIEYSPTPKIGPGWLEFRWDSPTALNYDYSVKGKVRNQNLIKQLRKKSGFPVSGLDSSYLTYTESQDTIDSGEPAMNLLASELTAGEDDQYMAVHKIADWVISNVAYDESRGSVSQDTMKATWVLENRYGVCDELTGVFIGLLRSVGIPARYVSGLAYSNLNGMDGWGPHAWAEVYYPDQGWVPYDVTYGELGFVDATHIRLKESLDSDESSTEFEWKGYGIDIEAKGLELEAVLEGRRGKTGEAVSISAEFLKERVGFGSYNLLEVTVKNLHEYYLTTEVSLSRNPEIQVSGPYSRFVALKPNEEKKEYWVIKLSQNLDVNYVYQIPIQTYTTRNSSEVASFEARKALTVYTKEDIENLLSELEEVAEKKYSKDLSLECSSEKEQYFIYETANYECTLGNLGNIAFNGIEVCLEADCKLTDLGIGQSKKIEFLKSFNETGEKELLVSAKNDVLARYDNKYLEILDEASAGIEDIQYPKDIRYSEEFEISFLVERKSDSVPKDVKILIEGERFRKEWFLTSMEANQRFIIKLKGKNFKEGVNTVRIRVEYSDELGKGYSTEASIELDLVNVTFFQRIMIWLYGFDSWIVQKLG